jgi:ribosomal protein S27E
MGNKTPPPAQRRSPAASSSTTTSINNTNQFTPRASSPSMSNSAADGPLLRCPACSRTVRAPAGAQRFRCPCGRVLAQPNTLQPTQSAPAINTPPLTSQVRSVPPQTAPSVPLTGMTRSVPPAPVTQNHQAPAGPPMRVRCPSCQQVLLAPNARKLHFEYSI